MKMKTTECLMVVHATEFTKGQVVEEWELAALEDSCAFPNTPDAERVHLSGDVGAVRGNVLQNFMAFDLSSAESCVGGPAGIFEHEWHETGELTDLLEERDVVQIVLHARCLLHQAGKTAAAKGRALSANMVRFLALFAVEHSVDSSTDEYSTAYRYLGPVTQVVVAHEQADHKPRFDVLHKLDPLADAWMDAPKDNERATKFELPAGS